MSDFQNGGSNEVPSLSGLANAIGGLAGQSILGGNMQIQPRTVTEILKEILQRLAAIERRL